MATNPSSGSNQHRSATPFGPPEKGTQSAASYSSDTLPNKRSGSQQRAIYNRLTQDHSLEICRIFVHNLPAATEHELLEVFTGAERFEVSDINRSIDYSGNHDGRAYIRYPSHEMAKEAVLRFDLTSFKGRSLRVALDVKSRMLPKLTNALEPPTTAVSIYHWPRQLTLANMRELLRRAGWSNSIFFRSKAVAEGQVKIATVHYISPQAAQRAMFIFHGLELYKNLNKLQAYTHPVHSRPFPIQPIAGFQVENPDVFAHGEETSSVLLKGLPSTVTEAELMTAMTVSARPVGAWIMRLPGQDTPFTLGSVQYESFSLAKQARDFFDRATLANGWRVDACFDHRSVIPRGLPMH